VTASVDPYIYPGTKTLKNRLGITDPRILDKQERRAVVQRIREGIPAGAFDLVHLQAIHRHLFQDIYDWAGEIRTVEISKGAQQFQFRQYIHTGMADVHRRLVRSRFLAGLPRQDFGQQVAMIIGDVNYIHPFREGNGRTQLQYLKLLAERAGHPIDLAVIDSKRWIEASQISHGADYALMARLIVEAMQK
jgi:cell filamentation protein